MRIRVLCTILAFLFWLPPCGMAEETANGRVNRALLVGCDRFVSQISTAPSAANNVSMMARALSGGTMDLAALTAVPEGVASTGELAGLILDTFSDADGDDVSLFYISTHGEWEPGHAAGSMTLLLSDGETESGVTAHQLRTMFDEIEGHKVLFIDACHSGAMLGKGVDEHLASAFAGPDYTVICSSGGMEDSWFWSGYIDGERLAGAGYFSGALVRAMSVEGGYGADDNRDGLITLTELRRYLLLNHGASTIRTWPEESSMPIFTYDAAAYTGRGRDAAIEGITFDTDVLTASEPTAYFTFNVARSVQVAYQIVYHRNGQWDFDNAELIYDNNGDFRPWAVAGRSLSPGMKERAITLDRAAGEDSGYVLLQVLTIDRGMPAVACSRVLCVTAESGDPQLSIEAPEVFCPGFFEELTFLVRHMEPCELTVTIEDESGRTVRRLTARQATRPEHLTGGGTSLTWDGCDNAGEPVAPGAYRIRVKAYVGDERYEALSEEILLLGLVG